MSVVRFGNKQVTIYYLPISHWGFLLWFFFPSLVNKINKKIHFIFGVCRLVGCHLAFYFILCFVKSDTQTAFNSKNENPKFCSASIIRNEWNGFHDWNVSFFFYHSKLFNSNDFMDATKMNCFLDIHRAHTRIRYQTTKRCLFIEFQWQSDLCVQKSSILFYFDSFFFFSYDLYGTVWTPYTTMFIHRRMKEEKKDNDKNGSASTICTMCWCRDAHTSHTHTSAAACIGSI